jgi:hypothetical protein
MAVGPTFNYGVPKVWVGIEKDDPSVFESQAAYSSGTDFCSLVKNAGLILSLK